jgi:hypothetical protein
MLSFVWRIGGVAATAVGGADDRGPVAGVVRRVTDIE